MGKTLSFWQTALLGVGAGTVAGVVQPAVAKVDEKLVFRRHEDANIAHHLAEAVAHRLGADPPRAATWLAGLGFHVGYSLFWGTAYAFVRERTGVSPLAGGLGLSALLYVLAFSGVGAGTLLRSEPPPWRRPPRYWLLTATMPLSFGLTAAAVYERLRPLARRDDEAESGQPENSDTKRIPPEG